LGAIVSERLKTCPGREQPLQSRRDFKSTGGVKYDPIVLLPFSKAIGADGEFFLRLVSNFQLKNWWRA